MRRFCKLIAHLLIVCMAWTPFSIQAGLIGTDQVVASAQDQVNRDKVMHFVQRGDVAKQLQQLGLSTASAQERVNAMTQQEVNQLAGNIDSLPAGALDSAGWILVLLVVGAVVWFMYYRR
ncbi:MAG TPA: PA2779 family protein [Burkholderiales bacterium]|nr:PA2779 family protein [Burkholderiales bacterium]